MRPQLVFKLLLFGLCFQCSNEKPTDDSAVLSLAFGTYYNWTNYELRQINFRISDKELLIDTTYNLKLADFKIHFTEKTTDYPEITEFLKKPSIELVDLKEKLDELNKINCGRPKTFWIQIKGTKEFELITYEWTDECNPQNIGHVTSVFEEMSRLKDKYK
jgi:hypothetical protein